MAAPAAALKAGRTTPTGVDAAPPPGKGSLKMAASLVALKENKMAPMGGRVRFMTVLVTLMMLVPTDISRGARMPSEGFRVMPVAKVATGGAMMPAEGIGVIPVPANISGGARMPSEGTGRMLLVAAATKGALMARRNTEVVPSATVAAKGALIPAEGIGEMLITAAIPESCLLYTSPSPRDS